MCTKIHVYRFSFSHRSGTNAPKHTTIRANILKHLPALINNQLKRGHIIIVWVDPGYLCLYMRLFTVGLREGLTDFSHDFMT